jgi:hypothetical protein
MSIVYLVLRNKCSTFETIMRPTDFSDITVEAFAHALRIALVMRKQTLETAPMIRRLRPLISALKHPAWSAPSSR